MSIVRKARFLAALGLAAGLLLTGPAQRAAAAELPDRVTVDWAYYNPLSLVLREKGWLEEALGEKDVDVRWVQSLGSNKAIEFMNSGSAEFGSTAGAAALLGRINGGPFKAIYVYSKPEWTALVTRADSDIRSVEDLKGRRVAVTRGTDPYIFLIRALALHGLSEDDIRPVLLQHQDGRTALDAGQVDAWAGLDPMMAQTELENGARLFFRDPDLNTYGILNVREEFAAEYPELVNGVLAAYERARRWALENPDELRRILAEAAGLSDEVAAKQLERTDLGDARIGPKHVAAITEAGLALQESGIIAPDVDVAEAVAGLIEPRFAREVITAASPAEEPRYAAD